MAQLADVKIVHTVRVEIVHHDMSTTCQSSTTGLTVDQAVALVREHIASRVVRVGSWQVVTHTSFTTRVTTVTDLREDFSDVRVIHTSAVVPV